MSETYDAIVELGYRFEAEWEFPQHLKDSLVLTAELYKKMIAPVVIVCGKWSVGFDNQHITPPFTESAEMKKKLILLGVPQEVIITEKFSKDTIGNAYFVKTKIIKPREFHSLLIVCADFHAPRVKYIFMKIFGNEYVLRYKLVTTPYNPIVEQSEKKLLEKQKEILDSMKNGDDTYLKEKLYSNPIFHT